ncbi:MAG: solute-binding protein [Akkermansiaceae bacterium]|nr:solute-binding protein [Akkermansiaceae bacterium]
MAAIMGRRLFHQFSSSQSTRASNPGVRNQSMTRLAAGSILAVTLLVFGLLSLNRHSQKIRKPKLQVYCAASLKEPLEEISRKYEQENGTQIILQFGGSGALLATIEATRSGDLFIPADSSYLDLVREKKLGTQSLQIATMRPVLAVARGNPKQVRGWKNFVRESRFKIRTLPSRIGSDWKIHPVHREISRRLGKPIS